MKDKSNETKNQQKTSKRPGSEYFTAGRAVFLDDATLDINDSERFGRRSNEKHDPNAPTLGNDKAMA